MTMQRLALAAAVVTTVSMSGCAMWSGMTSRLGGGDTTAAQRTGPGAAPGSAMTASRDNAPGAVATQPIPRFSSYAECQAWLVSPAAASLSSQARGLDGEVTVASQDPCLLGGWAS